MPLTEKHSHVFRGGRYADDVGVLVIIIVWHSRDIPGVAIHLDVTGHKDVLTQDWIMIFFAYTNASLCIPITINSNA